jgi:ectoine hydroxylase-related dioxygenase (phytanoyl-CoA dioxygenase family)
MIVPGTCILIHGQVVHHSEPNRSQNSRHAYTFHAVEQKDTKYAADNWLQPTEKLPFPELYKN